MVNAGRYSRWTSNSKNICIENIFLGGGWAPHEKKKSWVRACKALINDEQFLCYQFGGCVFKYHTAVSNTLSFVLPFVPFPSLNHPQLDHL